MSRVTPLVRGISRYIVEIDDRLYCAPGWSVINSMHPVLLRLMGHGGTRMLLSRALFLSSHEAPWLARVVVNSRAFLENIELTGAELDPETFLEGKVELFAQIMAMLVAYIGPTLTSDLVGEIWPQVAPEDRNFAKDTVE